MSQQKVISLSMLPEAGLHFVFDEKSAELNEHVRDLIGREPYLFEFDMKPLGNVYELRGKLRTRLPLACSKCGIDVFEKVDQGVHELFVIEDARSRNDQNRKTAGHSMESEDSGLFCNYLTSDRFDIGEYLHELIAAAEPNRPLGKPECDLGTCENDPKFKNLEFTSGAEPKRDSPFASLKSLITKK